MPDADDWISYEPGGVNAHLTPVQRDQVERSYPETQARRGRCLVSVVVEVFENGEAVPQVQFPLDSPVGPDDLVQTARLVATAERALADWR